MRTYFGFRTTLMKGFDPLQMLTNLYIYIYIYICTHILYNIFLVKHFCMLVLVNYKVICKLSLHLFILNFRNEHLSARNVARYSNAHPLCPPTSWSTRTRGHIPANTVARDSTRNPTWRNTPSYTLVRLRDLKLWIEWNHLDRWTGEKNNLSIIRTLQNNWCVNSKVYRISFTIYWVHAFWLLLIWQGLFCDLFRRKATCV